MDPCRLPPSHLVGLLQGDAHQAVGALLHPLLRDRPGYEALANAVDLKLFHHGPLTAPFLETQVPAEVPQHVVLESVRDAARVGAWVDLECVDDPTKDHETTE